LNVLNIFFSVYRKKFSKRWYWDETKRAFEEIESFCQQKKMIENNKSKKKRKEKAFSNFFFQHSASNGPDRIERF